MSINQLTQPLVEALISNADALQIAVNQHETACLGSQYAGWSLAHDKFFSLGSGPARAIAQREEIYKELAYQDTADQTVLVLETDQVPPIEVVNKVANDTGVDPKHLHFILTPTSSLAGTVQITARVLEVALHKLHSVHFPLENLLDGYGVAPIPRKTMEDLLLRYLRQ